MVEGFKPRAVIRSPVPIDNLKIRELQSTGQNGLDHMLTYKVPSYNALQQTISDATALPTKLPDYILNFGAEF